MIVGVSETHLFVSDDMNRDDKCRQWLHPDKGDDFYCMRRLSSISHRVIQGERGDGALIEGVGPDVPKVTNAVGGQQSELHYRFDLIDGPALFALAQVLDYGTRVRGYPEENWRLIPARDNLNHALMHAYAWLAGDRQDKHLEHAFTRMMFALGVALAEDGGVPVK